MTYGTGIERRLHVTDGVDIDCPTTRTAHRAPAPGVCPECGPVRWQVVPLVRGPAAPKQYEFTKERTLAADVAFATAMDPQVAGQRLAGRGRYGGRVCSLRTCTCAEED